MRDFVRISWSVAEPDQQTMAVSLKHPVPDPQPYSYEKEIYIKGIQYQKPPFTFKTNEWEPEAKKVLSANSWGYVYGSAGTGESTAKNAEAFRRWSIVANRMIDEGWPDLSTTVLGQKLPYPIAICPVSPKLSHYQHRLTSTRLVSRKFSILTVK